MRGWRALRSVDITAALDWRNPQNAGVYALYRAGRLVYVGRTFNLRSRLTTHRRRVGFTDCKVAFVDDEQEQKRLERRLIFRLRPSSNRTIPAVADPGRDVRRREGEAN